MQTALRIIVRSTAAILCYLLLINQFAYAAPAQEPTAIANQESQQAVAQQQATAQQASARATADAQAASSNSSASSSVQRPAPVAPQNAPIPTQIAAAHKVFVANLGADDNFPIDSTQTYKTFYTGLEAWGHYQLVTTPDQADLVFQLRDINPLTNVSGDRNGVYSTTSPAFQLTIIDPRNNIALWTITSPVYIAGKNQVKARWISVAQTNLMSRLKVLAGQPLTASESADLTNFPKSHGNVWVPLVIIGGVAALSVGRRLAVESTSFTSLP